MSMTVSHFGSERVRERRKFEPWRPSCRGNTGEKEWRARRWSEAGITSLFYYICVEKRKEAAEVLTSTWKAQASRHETLAGSHWEWQALFIRSQRNRAKWGDIRALVPWCHTSIGVEEPRPKSSRLRIYLLYLYKSPEPMRSDSRANSHNALTRIGTRKQESILCMWNTSSPSFPRFVFSHISFRQSWRAPSFFFLATH